ncbi:MAG: hypothetical protein WBR18_09660 [Anaerolineales bacterium]
MTPIAPSIHPNRPGRRLLIAGTLGIGLLLAACSADTTAAMTPVPLTPTDPLPTAAAAPLTIPELKAALLAAGASVEDGDRLEHQLAVAGRELLVGGESLQVYQVPSTANRDLLAADLADAAGDSRPPALWASAGLVVSYAGEDGGTRLLLSGLLGDPLQAKEAVQDEPYPPAVLAAIHSTAQQANVPMTEVDVASFSPETWENDCLGLPEAGQDCGTSPIDGWRVILQAGGSSYELHTDAFGERIRIR